MAISRFLSLNVIKSGNIRRVLNECTLHTDTKFEKNKKSDFINVIGAFVNKEIDQTFTYQN